MTAWSDFAPTTTAFDLDLADRCLKPRGEVNAVTVPALLDAANAFMAAAVGDLTIDLAGITFADTELLHALEQIRHHLRAQGAGLWLINEPACVRRLFVASRFRVLA